MSESADGAHAAPVVSLEDDNSNAERSVDNVRDMFRWPQNVAQAFSVDAASRLHSMLVSKVVVASDYSGYGSEIEALSCTLRELQKQCHWNFAEFPFIFKRVCDIGPVPQKVLTALSLTCHQGRMCVFEDVVDHCHPNAAEYLRASVPPEGCSQQEAENAHSEILQWLLRNRSWALADDVKQRCLVHKKQCSVCPMASWIANSQVMLAKKRKHAEAMLEGDSHSQSSNEKLARVLSPSTDEDLSCCKPGLDRPWSISFAGVTCDGWSSMGSQQRFGHMSELPHAVWLVERLVRGERCAEDVGFVECTSRYPAAAKHAPLQGSHRLLHFTCNPLLLGYPVSRPRVFGALLNTATVAWIGPEDWEQDFLAKFGADCKVSGDCLFAAADSERFEEYSQLAASQKNFISPESFRSLSAEQCLQSILSPGQQQRVAKFLDRRTDLESPGGHFLFDADHHIEARRMAGPFWPCMLTHGCIISAPRCGEMRLATGLEHFGAQGLHLYHASSVDNPVSPLKPMLQDLKIHQQKNLSGRGVHLAVLSSFMWYVLSHTVPLWQASPLRNSLSWQLVDNGDNGDDDNEDESQGQ